MPPHLSQRKMQGSEKPQITCLGDKASDPGLTPKCVLCDIDHGQALLLGVPYQCSTNCQVGFLFLAKNSVSWIEALRFGSTEINGWKPELPTQAQTVPLPASLQFLPRVRELKEHQLWNQKMLILVPVLTNVQLLASLFPCL